MSDSAVQTTTYTTADGQTIAVPGNPVRTTLETPADLLQELQAAFGSEAYRATTSAAMQAAPGVPINPDPRVNGADAAAAMRAALGTDQLPTPTVDAHSPTAPFSPPAATASPSASSTPAVAAPPVPGPAVPGTGEALPSPQSAPPAAPAVDPVLATAGVPSPDDALTALSQPPTGDPATDPNAPPAPPLAPPGGYDYRYYDAVTGAEQVRHLPDEVIGQAIAQAAWIENLPDQTKSAWAAIEAGQAVAIPRSEFDRYQAFLNQSPSPIPTAPFTPQFTPQFTPAPGAPLAPGPSAPFTPPQIDYSDLDPQTAAAVQQLQQQNFIAQQQLAATQAAYEQQVREQAGQRFDQQAAARAQAFDAAIGEYARQRNLTPQETELLVEGAIRGEYVPLLDRRLSTRNQVTGEVLVPADPYRVVFGALDHALTDNPALYASVSGRQSAPTAPATQEQAVPANPQFPATQATQAPAGVPTVGGLAPDITAKKAQAASLATAPAAAVQQQPRDVRTMSREETAAAMAGDIERFWQQS